MDWSLRSLTDESWTATSRNPERGLRKPERRKNMDKTAVIKKLVKAGFGLPKAIKIYNELSSNGFYEVSSKELAEYIKKNGI